MTRSPTLNLAAAAPWQQKSAARRGESEALFRRDAVAGCVFTSDDMDASYGGVTTLTVMCGWVVHMLFSPVTPPRGRK